MFFCLFICNPFRSFFFNLLKKVRDLYLASAVVEFLAKSKFCLHLVDGRYREGGRRGRSAKLKGAGKIRSAGVG